MRVAITSLLRVHMIGSRDMTGGEPSAQSNGLEPKPEA